VRSKADMSQLNLPHGDTLCISGFIDDIEFAHNVHACIATRKGHALKVHRSFIGGSNGGGVGDL